MLDVLTFSPDGKVLAVADNDRMYTGSTITVWDVAPGEAGKPPSAVLRHTLRGHSHFTFSLAFFPDGRTLVSGNGDRTVRLWDTSTGQEMARFIPHQHPTGHWESWAYCVATAPDGQTFATWGADGIKLWDRESMGLFRVLDARGLGCSLAFTEDGRSLIAENREAVYYWSVASSPLPFFGLLGATAVVVAWLFWSGSFSTPSLPQKAEVA
jgi:WD40 repeat protein